MNNDFAYNHSLQDRRIRLLRVILEFESNILAIDLVEESLDEAEFEALSYVWGHQPEKIPIKCNDKRLSIGANLYAALHERRRRGSTAFLWADQISINQDDTEEKTRQVRMMRDIYARADQVIIWLGKQQPGDVDGLQLAKNLYKECDGQQYNADAGKYDFHDFECKIRGVPNPVSDFNVEYALQYYQQFLVQPSLGHPGAFNGQKVRNMERVLRSKHGHDPVVVYANRTPSKPLRKIRHQYG
jgi:hypothetical protein